MKISALRFFNVKRFADRGIAIENISDGVNVLCAVNEFGKSTSFEALHALFFQSHKGTPGDVQRLRPYSGGNPLVEADIATSDGRYRLNKQFYGGGRASVTDLASGRLIAQADEAENFIAGLIRGGTAGPAGLLWVRQGLTGIERRSKSEEDSDKSVRASLLESVQGEVEAVTGGRRMAEIAAACADALGALVTATGRPKAGGRFAAALQEHERLLSDEQRLRGEVSALREALESRGRAQKRLGELETVEEKAQRQAAVAQAQDTFDAAKAHAETLRTADAEWTLAKERRAAASQALASYRQALADTRRVGVELEDAARRRSEAAARRQAAAETIDRASAAVDAAEAEEREARDLLDRLDAALKARDAAVQLADAQARLAEAEGVRRSVELGEAELAAQTVSSKSVEALQALEIEIASLRAAEDAVRPTVSVVYQDSATERLLIDGSELGEGEVRGFGDRAEIVVPRIGVVTLRSNRPPSTDCRLDTAEQQRRALLTALGVDNLATARRRHVEAQDKAAELARLRDRIAWLAPNGLPELRADVARRTVACVEQADVEGDAEAVRQGVAQVGRAVVAARNLLREAQPERARADEALVAAETAMAMLKAELARLDSVLGDESQRPDRERALSDSFEAADAHVTRLEGEVLRLRSAAPDLMSAQAALRRAQSVETAATQEAARLNVEIADLNGQIRTRSDEAIEEQWLESREALAAAEARRKAFEREVAVLQRLQSTLAQARSAARDVYLKPVMTELQPLLGLLFDDVSIAFDERTLLPQTIQRNGQEEDVERLSGGMREQLSILTRLAFARLLAKGGRPAPVILDDALVYSDDDRIERMFDALHRQSQDQQIIVFSCRQRAFAKLGGNVLVTRDWRPGA